MPRVWPGPKGWGKCPVLQPLAQMLFAEAVGVELPCQGTAPSLCGATGTCQEIQHSQQPPAGPTLSAALSLDPPLCGARQKLGRDAGRQGRAKERQATSPDPVWQSGHLPEHQGECWDNWAIPEVQVLDLEPIGRKGLAAVLGGTWGH